MNYAIIAAGDGSRLVKEGVKAPKPLVEVNNEKLIDRLIRIFTENNAHSISIIVNGYMTEVEEYLKKKTTDIPVNIIVKTTESSMHSFYELSKVIPKGKFCLTTVDTIFHEEEFKNYISAFESNDSDDALFAVTDYIDDESPLFVDVDNQMKVKGFYDKDYEGSRYISGGIYCLQDNAIPVLINAINNNQFRMRNYQRALIESGINIKAYQFKKIIDVDHAEDIAKANQFLCE